MYSTLKVTSAASKTKLVTLAQLKIDLGLNDTQDDFFNRVIDLCSNEIAFYLARGRDESDDVTIGRETLSEVLYDVCGERELRLSRRPVGAVTSVKEGSAAAINRLIGNSDGAITATQTTFTSAGGPASGDFTSLHVGKAFTVAGAGASGGTLETTVASVTDANTVELADAAATTVSAATWTVENPAYNYVVRKQAGRLWKRVGLATTRFYSEPITVVYTAGWLLPGETGRNLPRAIEDACVLYCRRKIDQLQEGQDFSGALQAASIEGVGSFTFEGSGDLARGFGIPMEVRALLDRFRDPIFA